MLEKTASMTEIILPGRFSPGGGCGPAEERPLSPRRKAVYQSKGGKLDLKIIVLVVDDNTTRRKIMSNYLHKKGLKKSVRIEESKIPQAIFWLKK